MTGGVDDAPLRAILEEGRALGFLGPGPVESHLAGAVALAALVGGAEGPVLDLGAGAGVPGLVLARLWSTVDVTLLDASARRCAFLRRAADTLGLSNRVHVAEGRAESLARSPALAGHFGTVVARGFGPPAVTAECAVRFLVPGGRLVVTEPPPGASSDERWPPAELARLGLSPASVVRQGDTSVAVMQRIGELDDRYPRRTGVPAKRPLWGSSR